MKTLIIDRDELTVQMIQSKLHPIGHTVYHEAGKNDALERLKTEEFDCIMLDPAPLSSARPVILNIRRTVGNYPFIFLLSEEETRINALQAGANDILNKPVSVEDLLKKIGNADLLMSRLVGIGDDSEDFPSAGGVIAKSAFNQLFLSAIDRADRYGEVTSILFITMSNYQDIVEQEGAYAADYAVAKLSQYLVLLRRQSDIIGQTKKFEYALLLQRPVYETEPLEAANRFAESLASCKEISTSGNMPVEITVSLLEVPTGAKPVQYVLCPGQSAP